MNYRFLEKTKKSHCIGKARILSIMVYYLYLIFKLSALFLYSDSGKELSLY